MADPIPFEQQAEALKIRSAPKPVTRINRKVVIASAGLAIVLLFLGASVALNPPRAVDNAAREELYNTRNRPTAEELNALPASYADMPILGEPVPGDLGATIVAQERAFGIAPQTVQEPVYDFRPDPATDRLRAEHIRMAKLAQESLEAPVFFQLSQRRTELGADSASASRIDGNGGKFDALIASGFDPGTGTLGIDVRTRNADPNLQDTKNAFAVDPLDADIYNPHRLEDAASPYQVMAGAIIPASLITGLNSDLPGNILAQVTQNVYDTATGKHLVIPQGARLIGRYDSRVSFGQERALVVWDRIIFPDASSILIEALPGTDQRGFAGLHDRVDNHLGRLFVAVGLATLLEVRYQLP
ncbi:MAG: TrbI/VirB10 family protein, partial [Pseudomonadota bacterium]